MELLDEKFEDPNKLIGFKLKSLRMKEELSQQNVADDLGISATAYSKIENGRTSMSVNRLYQISNYFKIFVADLFDARIVTPRSLQEIGELSEREQASINKYLVNMFSERREPYKRGK